MKPRDIARSMSSEIRFAAGVALLLLSGLGPARPQEKKLDPSAWGGNHAGKPIPEYVHGDECLFCHRNDIGPTWQKNAHGTAVRQQEDAQELQRIVRGEPALAGMVSEIEYFMGSRRHVRFLKKQGYGKFALLSTQAVLTRDRNVEKWIELERPAWDKDKFANRCAGCHSTAVDPETRTFSAFGLDCFTCHGNVSLEHTNDTSLILLSKKRRTESQAVTSICAQCHIRLGKSRSTGLPYANNFVAGDNLFQDFEVDFSRADDVRLNPGDRHVLRSIRDVAVFGSDTTCLSCHQVHSGSTSRHRLVVKTAICLDCHNAEGPMKPAKQYEVHSPLCEY
jgi:predicted CXXCH cytochrome family protein